MNTQSQRGVSSIVWMFVGVVLLVGLVGIYYGTIRQPAPEVESDTMVNEDTKSVDSMVDDGTTTDAMMKDEVATSNDSQAMVKYSGKVLAGSQSKVLDFNQIDYEVAKKANKTILLYFYANWCPICKAEIPNFYSAFDSLSSDQIVAFRVNFNDSDTDENEKALAREFGVAYQHTKVIIKNGQRVLKSPESWDQNRYMAELSAIVQ